MSHPLQTENLNVCGSQDAAVLVVCDAPSDRVFDLEDLMPDKAMMAFGGQAEMVGMHSTDFAFITPCPPIPPEVSGSDSRESKFIKDYTTEFHELVRQFPNVKLIVTLGALAAKQVLGRPVKITRIRGRVQPLDDYDCLLLPIYSPTHVLRRPELRNTFETDFRTIATLKNNNWQPEERITDCDYGYSLDLSAWIENRPKTLSLDIESKGGHWYDPTYQILTVQLTRKSGEGIVIPLDEEWFNAKWENWTPPVKLNPKSRARAIEHIKTLLEDPRIAVTGTNLSSDILGLRKCTGISVRNWRHETLQLVFVNDENMLDKGLDESTRRFVFELAGYADEFNRTVDKEHMEGVHPTMMLPYAGSDPDASHRLTRKLVPMGMGDYRNWNCYQRIQMPSLREFCNVTERGIRIDKDALRDLGKLLKKEEAKQYTKLIKQVPQTILRKHAEAGLKFSRPEFVIDILFRHRDSIKDADGERLMPLVFTKTTRKLKGTARVPSVSLKDHLPYFEDVPFVKELIEYQQLRHMREKYVGEEGGVPIPQKRKNAPPKFTEPSGFWKYLVHGDRIHPSFFLHRVVTGRTSSAYPNAQNFPKRGKIAKAFRKIFIPTDGYKFIEIDLSQAELRIAAWMAQEPTMLRIYAEGGDIHEATAAAIIRVPLDEFRSWKDSDEPIPAQYMRGARDCTTLGELYDLRRYHAKSVNFGFLYGMGWKKFRIYAKTNYGVDFTEEESQEMRATFFRLYPKLKEWHQQMRNFVHAHGYVRSLHGALRRLPNIYSDDEDVQGGCERQAINSPVQRFASDLGLLGMIRIARDADSDILRTVAFIHDALILEVKDGYEEEAMMAAKFYMQTPPLEEWFRIVSPIPIVADVSLSPRSLGEMEEQKDVQPIAPEWYREELDLAA
jgi:uracil-DNA glycosylase family 4